MRILVVGASGYIGSRLVTLLQDRGHELVADAINEGWLLVDLVEHRCSLLA